MAVNALTIDDLPNFFSAAQALYDQATAKDCDPTVTEQTNNAIHMFRQICRLIDSHSLFSTNEELDDIDTNALQYVLALFYLADLLSKAPISVEQDRIAILKQSQDVRTILRQDHADPSETRGLKIAQYNREKQAKQALQELTKRRELLRKRNEDAEEVDRDYVLTLIRLCAVQACQQFQMVQTELEMLEYITKMKTDGSFQKRWDQEHRPPNQPPQKPITILSAPSAQRIKIQQDVFKPSYTLPTMTPEEAFMEELRQGNAIVKSDPPKNPEEEEEEEESDQDDPDKLAKKRAWDDWKDEHRRGSGNTKGQG